MFFSRCKKPVLISIVLIYVQMNAMEQKGIIGCSIMNLGEDIYEQPLIKAAIALQQNIDNAYQADGFSEKLTIGYAIQKKYKKVINQTDKTIFSCIQHTYPRYSTEMQLRTYAQAFGEIGKKYIALSDSFHAAVLNNKFKKAEELLNKGVNVEFLYAYKDQRPWENGQVVEGSFLAYLCLTRYNDTSSEVRNKTVQQIEFLLQQGANPNVIIDHTMYLLHMLIVNKYPVLVKLLLKYKANVHAAFLKDGFLFGKKGTTVLDMLKDGWLPEITPQEIEEYIK